MSEEKRCEKQKNDETMYLEYVFLTVILCVTSASQCTWGKFGDNCERNCSCNCALVKNNTAKHCRKSDGECSEGCIPGWYGIHCANKCSENCPNKICNQHNGHCSQGCPQNYKGIWCNISKDFSNPDICTRDSAQPTLVVVLGSCLGISVLVNVILSVGFSTASFKRRLNTCKGRRNPKKKSEDLNQEHASPNCKNCLLGKCDEEGICTDGCEPGFADIFCQHPCQETCLKSRCFVDNHTGTTMCTDGCVDGFCYPACKIPCPEGCLRCERMLCESCTLCEGHLYGQSCQHSCFDKCKGYACSIEGNCSMDKCMDGRYGKSCNESCKPRYESCHQESGQCIKCRQGLFGDDCQNHCSHECLSMEEDMMYRCRSGCTLCQLPPHTDSKKDLGCTENSMEAKLNSALGLCSAVLLIAVTILFLNIKKAWPLNRGCICGENNSVSSRISNQQSPRAQRGSVTGVSYRHDQPESRSPLFENEENPNDDQSSQHNQGSPLFENEENPNDDQSSQHNQGSPLFENEENPNDDQSSQHNQEADSEQPAQQTKEAVFQL